VIFFKDSPEVASESMDILSNPSQGWLGLIPNRLIIGGDISRSRSARANALI